jgi:molybdopterin converting factor small subunit
VREVLKKPEISLQLEREDETVGSVVRVLIERFGERLKNELIDPNTGEISTAYQIFVDGKYISSLSGLDSKLKENNVVEILYPAAGGTKP